MNARQMTIGYKLRRAQLLQPAANASVRSVRESRGLNPPVAKPVDHHDP
jgi:hypothetical protein